MSEQGVKAPHRGWTIAGTIAGICSVLIAWMAFSTAGNGPNHVPPLEGATSQTPQQPAPAATPKEVASVSAPTAEQEVALPALPETLFLMDLEDESVVRRPHWVWADDGSTTINGVEYASSVMYEFQNCSSCNESLEVLVPAGYRRLTGVFGLSDKSRHDGVIDGVVYLAIYDASGNQILAKQRIEYPEAVGVDLDISQTPRIRIEMSEGTNFEEFALGDAAFHRS